MGTERDLLTESLGGYDIGEELGRGATGIVLAGRHRGLGRDVAIKRLPRLFGSDADLRARFLSEARLLASLDHPHIVRIYDYLETEGVCALVMERLPGGTVWDRLAGGGLPPQVACAVIVATCSALHYAHGKGVLHRDIKPQNLMFSSDGVLKVTDFGIAKVLGGTGATATEPGEVLGTPAYIAPEQLQGSAPGPALDIYATGVLLYLLLCGELPFPPAADAITELYQHVHMEPVPLLERNPHLPEALGDIATCALARDPKARYESARDFAVAVTRAATAVWGPAWTSEAGVRLLGTHPALGDDATRHRPAASPGGRAVAPRHADGPAEPGVTVSAEPGVTVSAEPGAAADAGLTMADAAPGGPPLLERDRELQALSDALQDACAGDGALVAISGPPGIGRTRLVEEAVREARGRGMQAMAVRAERDDAASSLAVVRRLCEPVAHRHPPAKSGDLAAVVTAMAAQGPVAIAIDDLQWGDPQSLEVLLAVVARLEELPLAVVLAARSEEPEVAQALLEHFIGERFAPHLRPAPLSLAGVGELLRARWADAEDPFCQACWAASAGNPALVVELAEAVEAAGLAATADGAPQVREIALEQVPESVVRRIASVSAAASALARAVAITGDGAPASQVAAVSGLDEQAVARAAEELAAVDVLQPEQPLTFTDPRVRAAVYDALPPGERSAEHLACARLLHERGAPPDAVAAHLLAVAPGRDAWVVERLQEAAVRALGAGDAETALGYLERALHEPPGADQRAAIVLAAAAAHERAGRYGDAVQVLEEGAEAASDPRRLAELLIALGDVRGRAGESSDARTAYRHAAQVARSVGDPRLLALAALGYGLGPGDARYVAGVDETLVGLLQEALAVCEGEDSVLHVRLLSRLAVELHLTGAVDRRDALSRQAVDLARRLGNPAAELVALYSRLTSSWSPDAVAGRCRAAEDVVRRARDLGDAEMAFRGHRLKLRTLLETGDVAGADREIASLEEAAAEAGRRAGHWEATLYRAMRALHAGRAKEGERLALEALEIGRRVDPDAAARSFDAQIALHRWLVGRVRDVVPSLREGADRAPWLPVRRAALAAGLAELGRRTEAAAQFERLAADNFDSVPYDGNWLMTMALLSLACGLLADAERAVLLYEALTPFADRCVVGGDCTTTWAPVATALGVLGGVLERYEAAASHFDDGLDRARVTDAPAHVVLSQREYARMLLARGWPGDGERVTSLLDEAVAVAGRYGFAGLAGQAAALRGEVER